MPDTPPVEVLRPPDLLPARAFERTANRLNRWLDQHDIPVTEDYYSVFRGRLGRTYEIKRGLGLGRNNPENADVLIGSEGPEGKELWKYGENKGKPNEAGTASRHLIYTRQAVGESQFGSYNLDYDWKNLNTPTPQHLINQHPYYMGDFQDAEMVDVFEKFDELQQDLDTATVVEKQGKIPAAVRFLDRHKKGLLLAAATGFSLGFYLEGANTISQLRDLDFGTAVTDALAAIASLRFAAASKNKLEGIHKKEETKSQRDREADVWEKYAQGQDGHYVRPKQVAGSQNKDDGS